MPQLMRSISSNAGPMLTGLHGWWTCSSSLRALIDLVQEGCENLFWQRGLRVDLLAQRFVALSLIRLHRCDMRAQPCEPDLYAVAECFEISGTRALTRNIFSRSRSRYNCFTFATPSGDGFP